MLLRMSLWGAFVTSSLLSGCAHDHPADSTTYRLNRLEEEVAMLRFHLTEELATRRAGADMNLLDESPRLARVIDPLPQEPFDSGDFLPYPNTDDTAWGFISNSGKVVIPPTFEGAKPFTERLAAVKIGSKWGYIDTKGTIRIKPAFDDAHCFSEGLAPVRVGEMWGFVDRSGEIQVKPQLERVYGYSSGLAAFRSEGRWGYISKDGTVAVDATLEEARPFHEGLAVVRQEGRFGFINTSGTFAVTPQYEGAWSYRDGVACVKQKGSWGLIDWKGKSKFPFTWAHAEPLAGGSYHVMNKDGQFAVAIAGQLAEEIPTAKMNLLLTSKPDKAAVFVIPRHKYVRNPQIVHDSAARLEHRVTEGVSNILVYRTPETWYYIRFESKGRSPVESYKYVHPRRIPNKVSVVFE